MGLDTDLFSIITNPIDKLVKEAGANIVDTAENAIVGELSSVFQRIGLGNGSNRSILGNLGEQVLAGIAGEIFGAIGREMNLLSKSEIEDNRGVLTSPDSLERDTLLQDQVSRIPSSAAENIIFPPDLNDFYVQLDFKKYRRPAPAVPADVITEFSISLPLPRTLEDRHDVSYNDSMSLGFLGAIANQGQNGVTGLDTTTGLIYAGKEGIRAITGDGSDIIGLISQSFGASLNPHLSVMFQQPTLRRHKMQWMFAPNNPKESEIIRQITKKIRGASLPSFVRNQEGEANINTLTFPMMCKITLYPWGDKSKLRKLKGDADISYSGNMYTFKHCVIESVNINYAPSNPAFFSDEGNAPAFVLLDISFLEIEYFTGDDFGRMGDDIDLLKAFDNFAGDVLGGKNPADMTVEERQAAFDKIKGSVDPAAGADPAQATGTNNFNANNTIVSMIADPANADDPTKSNYLYQTSDGSWYKSSTVAGKETITPINSLSDPVFEQFNVYEQTVTPAAADAVQFTNGKKILIRTGKSGNLELWGSE
jgi:hypothetical protein